jgi:hypothetical protein
LAAVSYSRPRSKTRVNIRPYALRLIVAGLKPWESILLGFDGNMAYEVGAAGRMTVEF